MAKQELVVGESARGKMLPCSCFHLWSSASRDAKYLQHEMGVSRPSGAPEARALLPPLREDIRQMALQKPGPGTLNGEEATAVADRSNDRANVPLAEWRKGRRFLSCCVRLSPEKNADLFASLVEHLAPFLGSHGIVPLLCAGANSADPYAQSIKKRVSEAVPSALIIEGFMGPEKMGELYAQVSAFCLTYLCTLLHPPHDPFCCCCCWWWCFKYSPVTSSFSTG